jgi:hypothetical protein
MHWTYIVVAILLLCWALVAQVWSIVAQVRGVVAPWYVSLTSIISIVWVVARLVFQYWRAA